MRWVFLDKHFVREEKASIPITDRGFLFGDGVFTTLRVFQGKAEFLQAHLQRLIEHCQQLHIVTPHIEAHWIQELIERNNAMEGIWRLKIIVTGGHESFLHLKSRNSGHLLMTMQSYAVHPFTSCRLCVFPEPIVRPIARMKSLAYLDRLVVYDYAQARGYDDAIVCSSDGTLLETAFSNIFWIDHDDLFIPDESLPYLQGIIMGIIRKHSLQKVRSWRGSVESIPSRACVYICNSLAHVRPVIEIDKRPFERNLVMERELVTIVDEWRWQ